MLVLTRKRMESIAIGDNIRITVVKMDRNQVRIGIEAPADLMVLREELLRGPVEADLCNASSSGPGSAAE